MKIYRVTMTGIDESVPQEGAFFTSSRFPFLEWGILVSPKRSGTARYPSDEYRRTLVRALAYSGRSFAYHLCGQAARDFFEGRESSFVKEMTDLLKFSAVPVQGVSGYARMQINGFVAYEGSHKISFSDLRWSKIEFILQCPTAKDVAYVDKLAVDNKLDNFSALLDPSGGEGIRSLESWEHEPTKRIKVGLAGGIGPHNIGEVLAKVEGIKATNSGWIDMESRIRTDEKLDPKKVKQVLRACEEHKDVLWEMP